MKTRLIGLHQMSEEKRLYKQYLVFEKKNEATGRAGRGARCFS